MFGGRPRNGPWEGTSTVPSQSRLLNGAPGKPDIGLTPKSETEVTVRCLQEQCRIGKVTLKNGQSTDVPFDSDVSVTIQSSTH